MVCLVFVHNESMVYEVSLKIYVINKNTHYIDDDLEILD